MKISVDIDCTPEEARTFLGLPDVRPIQEALLKDIQERMSVGLRAMEPDAMMRVWMPSGVPGFEAFQRMFGTRMADAAKPDPEG